MATTLIRLEFRRNTATTWTSGNEVLLSGEPGFETDTGLWKLGDGTTGWNALTYQGLLPVGDIRRYGAVNNADCTAAFTAARAASPRIHVPAGTWTYNGTGLDWANVHLTGDGRGNSIIAVGAGRYLFQSATASTRFHASDVRISGGAGFLNLTSTSTNVANNGMQTFERIDFLNYTATAVGHVFADCPNWVFRDCAFFGANDTAAIGVALHGDAANSVFDHCVFGNDRVHVKIGAGNGGKDVRFHSTDFVRNNPYSANPRTDVWVVPATPSPSGPGAPEFSNCKFGPENRDARDYAILIADDTADSTTSLPNLATASTGELRGLKLTDCIYAANGRGSVIYTMTPNVPVTRIRGLASYGALPNYVLQFFDPATVAAAIGASTGSIDGVLNRDAGYNTAVRLTNSSYPALRSVGDVTRTLDTGDGNLDGGGSDLLGYAQTHGSSTYATLTAGGGNTVTAATDGLGGTAAQTLTAAAGSTLFGYTGLTGLTAGVKHWIEFDVAPAATGTSTGTVTVQARTGAGSVDWSATLTVPAGWRRYRYLYTPRTVATPQLAFTDLTGTTGTGLLIGRVRAYHAAEPVNPALATTAGGPNLQTFTTSGTWTKPAGATTVTVVAIGAGGGGGSGALTAPGTAAVAGGAGGSGSVSRISIPASILPNTVAVAVGVGGAGGTAVTAAGNGVNGGSGTATNFNFFAYAPGGSAGAGGTTSGNGGAGGLSMFNGGNGGSASTTGLAGLNGSASNGAAGGSGGGGGVTAAGAASNGGSGALALANGPSGVGSGGTAPGGVGGAPGGQPVGSGLPTHGSGGGAGAVTGVAGAGGNGARYGAGGGGGGASTGTSSGPGGTGSDGFVLVITT